jgi:Tricorn protease C1 domain
MNLTLDERTKVFDKVCHLVQKKHFDQGMNGVDWQALSCGLSTWQGRMLENNGIVPHFSCPVVRHRRMRSR